MDPKTLAAKDFTYGLPAERIASHPLPERDASKLLVHRKGRITEDVFRNITDHLPAGSLLVFNNTRVIEARVLFQKTSGGWIEIFCLEPHDSYADISSGMVQHGKVLWHCLVGGASKWKQGFIPEKKLVIDGKEVVLRASFIEKLYDAFVIEFSWEPSHYSFAEILHFAGAVPLPPYIKREPEEADAERYQTIYARFDGSVAAPTAGLHFTENIFKKFEQKNIRKEFVTLHVGAGTFKPVKSGVLADHEMHAEFFEVTQTAIENIANTLSGTIVPVGTTSLRTMESLYWLGVKTILNPSISLQDLQVLQWDAYELPQNVSSDEALGSLLNWMQQKKLNTLITKTQLLIAPGYQFRIGNGLVTNFHQPGSTLLLLIAAFTGDEWRNIYRYALEHDFRFLSYGDGCLLFRQ